MVSLLEKTVDPDNFVAVMIIVFLIAYFVYKEWPELKKRITGDTLPRQDNINEQILARLDNVEEGLVEVKNRLDRDYRRINDLEEMSNKQQKQINDSLEERKLILKGLTACLDGLEQLNCNHTVPATRQEITDYLNGKAHEV